jgi:hypothetical protein
LCSRLQFVPALQFDVMDSDASGGLDPQELAAFFDHLGLRVGADVLRDLVNDLGGDAQQVTFEQLLFALEGVPEASDGEGEAMRQESDTHTCDPDYAPSAAAMLQQGAADAGHSSAGSSEQQYPRNPQVTLTLSDPLSTEHADLSLTDPLAPGCDAVMLAHPLSTGRPDEPKRPSDVASNSVSSDARAHVQGYQWTVHNGMLSSTLSHETVATQPSYDIAAAPASSTVMVPIDRAATGVSNAASRYACGGLDMCQRRV